MNIESEPQSGGIVIARPAQIGEHQSIPDILPEITPRQAWLDAGLIFGVAIVIHYVPALFFQDTGISSEAGGKLDEIAVIGKWFEAAMVAGLAGYLILRNGVRPASFGIRAQKPMVQIGWGLGGLVAGYFYMFMSSLIAMAIFSLFPHGAQDLKHRVDFVSIMPVNDMWITVTLLSAVAIHEELLFRGLLLTLLRRASGSWWPAVLISSAIFGALHFQQGWLGILQVSGLSIVFSLIFIRSRSLPAVIIAHFGFDFLQFQLVRVLLPLMEKWQQQGALG